MHFVHDEQKEMREISNEELSLLIRKYIKEHRLNKKQLCSITGLSYVVIRKAIDGKNINKTSKKCILRMVYGASNDASLIAKRYMDELVDKYQSQIAEAKQKGDVDNIHLIATLRSEQAFAYTIIEKLIDRLEEL